MSFLSVSSSSPKQFMLGSSAVPIKISPRQQGGASSSSSCSSRKSGRRQDSPEPVSPLLPNPYLNIPHHPTHGWASPGYSTYHQSPPGHSTRSQLPPTSATVPNTRSEPLLLLQVWDSSWMGLSNARKYTHSLSMSTSLQQCSPASQSHARPVPASHSHSTSSRLWHHFTTSPGPRHSPVFASTLKTALAAMHTLQQPYALSLSPGAMPVGYGSGVTSRDFSNRRPASRDTSTHGGASFGNGQVSRDVSPHGGPTFRSEQVSRDPSTHGGAVYCSSQVSRDPSTHGGSAYGSGQVSRDPSTHGRSAYASGQVSRDPSTHGGDAYGSRAANMYASTYGVSACMSNLTSRESSVDGGAACNHNQSSSWDPSPHRGGTSGSREPSQASREHNQTSREPSLVSRERIQTDREASQTSRERSQTDREASQTSKEHSHTSAELRQTSREASQSGIELSQTNRKARQTVSEHSHTSMELSQASKEPSQTGREPNQTSWKPSQTSREYSQTGRERSQTDNEASQTGREPSQVSNKLRQTDESSSRTCRETSRELSPTDSVPCNHGDSAYSQLVSFLDASSSTSSARLADYFSPGGTTPITRSHISGLLSIGGHGAGGATSEQTGDASEPLQGLALLPTTQHVSTASATTTAAIAASGSAVAAAVTSSQHLHMHLPASTNSAPIAISQAVPRLSASHQPHPNASCDEQSHCSPEQHSTQASADSGHLHAAADHLLAASDHLHAASDHPHAEGSSQQGLSELRARSMQALQGISSRTGVNTVPQPTDGRHPMQIDTKSGFRKVFFSPLPSSYLSACTSTDSLLGSIDEGCDSFQHQAPGPLSHCSPLRTEDSNDELPLRCIAGTDAGAGADSAPDCFPASIPLGLLWELEEAEEELHQEAAWRIPDRRRSSLSDEAALTFTGLEATCSPASSSSDEAAFTFTGLQATCSPASSSSDEAALTFTGLEATSVPASSSPIQAAAQAVKKIVGGVKATRGQLQSLSTILPRSSSSQSKPSTSQSRPTLLPPALTWGGTASLQPMHQLIPPMRPMPPTPAGLPSMRPGAFPSLIPPLAHTPVGLPSLSQSQCSSPRPHVELLMEGHFPSIAMAMEVMSRRQTEWAAVRLVASCAMIPHKDKVDKGGEDAYCICQSGLGSIGVADGVSGWAEEGIDSSEYSRTLMRLTAEKLESVSQEVAEAREVIRHAHMATLLPGSATICLAVMQPHAFLEVANLGDSGVRIVRDGRLVFASAVQQHMFNMPFQLSHPSIIDSPDDADSADVSLVAVEPGDVIVLATDGLYDNVFEEEIVMLCQEASHRSRIRTSEFRRRNGAGLAQSGAGHYHAGAGAHHTFPDYEEHVSTLQAEAQELADFLAGLAHTYALSRSQQTPWSIAACEQGFSWSRYFAQGGGKMDDVTVVIAIVD